MAIGLLAKKLGMTELFNEQGRAVAVTVLEAGPCVVTQIKEPKKDGYPAIQIAFEPVAKEKKLSKAEQGHFKKAGTGLFRHLREFRLSAVARRQAGLPAPPQSVGGAQAGLAEEFKVGQQLTVDVFKEGELVDVTGTSIGKGFQGGVKRWHWKGGPETHGSMSHRSPGSIGSTTSPGRVFKGHHLPGHMGDDRVTVQNLRVMKIDAEANLLVVQGAVPGPENRLLMVRKSVKHPGKITSAKGLQDVAVVEEEGKSKGAAKAAKAAKKK